MNAVVLSCLLSKNQSGAALSSMLTCWQQYRFLLWGGMSTESFVIPIEIVWKFKQIECQGLTFTFYALCNLEISFMNATSVFNLLENFVQHYVLLSFKAAKIQTVFCHNDQLWIWNCNCIFDIAVLIGEMATE